jgi:hypothetical protein
MTGFRLSHSSRRFLLWTARLALVAYLVQIIAIDHWHRHSGEIVGVEGSAAHVSHCHGAGDCSDSGASVAPALSGRGTLPVPPVTLTVLAAETDHRPKSTFTETLLQPPRAA